MRQLLGALVGTVMSSLVLVASSSAQIPPPPEGDERIAQQYSGRVYSPYAERDFPDKVLFGDTHLHTSYSFDAGAFGNRLGIDEAYRFARGVEP